MILLPKEYVLAKFRQYAGMPECKGLNWNASCPICHEGKNWLKKKRLFYLTTENYFYCHNCSESWTPLNWIKEASGMEYPEIIKEIESEGYDFFEKEIQLPKKIVVEDLPLNPIDLSNPQQLEFYRDRPVIQHALKLIHDRRMDTAINRSKKYFISLDDWKYRNRVIIPHYDSHGHIFFYTARSLYKNQSPKYLAKVGEKEIFGLEKVDPSFPYIFLFEGQIDSMFIKNGIAVSGVILTDHQRKIIEHFFPNHELIWVLDNPKTDNASRKEIRKRIKIDPDFRCFTYPNKFATHKDINLYAIKEGIDSIDTDEFLAGCMRGNAILFNI